MKELLFLFYPHDHTDFIVFINEPKYKGFYKVKYPFLDLTLPVVNEMVTTEWYANELGNGMIGKYLIVIDFPGGKDKEECSIRICGDNLILINLILLQYEKITNCVIYHLCVSYLFVVCIL